MPQQASKLIRRLKKNAQNAHRSPNESPTLCTRCLSSPIDQKKKNAKSQNRKTRNTKNFPLSTYRHLGLPSPPPSSNRLPALAGKALLLLPPIALGVRLPASALGGLRATAGASESASFPSRNEGGTGSILLLRKRPFASGARKLDGGRRWAKALSGLPVPAALVGVAGTGREDLREAGVSLRENAAEGGRVWVAGEGSETMREVVWGVRRPERAGLGM